MEGIEKLVQIVAQRVLLWPASPQVVYLLPRAT
jgi:hypothetical protein